MGKHPIHWQASLICLRLKELMNLMARDGKRLDLPCPPWSGSIAGLWRATAKLNHLRCVGFHSDMAEKLKIKNVVYLFELGFCEF